MKIQWERDGFPITEVDPEIYPGLLSLRQPGCWIETDGDRRVRFRDAQGNLHTCVRIIYDDGAWIDAKGLHVPDGAMRFNSGKPELSYVLDFPGAAKALAAVSAYGAKKYERDNWKKGLDEAQLKDSLMRHLFAEGVDEESGLPHTWHALWNLCVLIEQEES